MPEAMSSKLNPTCITGSRAIPQRHLYRLGTPAKRLRKWGRTRLSVTRHCVAKYGTAEVESWLWEVWNEPYGGYWQGQPEEYHKLYDYAADAVKRALPTARIGDRTQLEPANPRAATICAEFLDMHFTARITPPARLVAVGPRAFSRQGQSEICE